MSRRAPPTGMDSASRLRPWRNSPSQIPRNGVRPMLRTMIIPILRKHGYPPDKHEMATHTTPEQAQLLCKDWSA
jgi:hypothetical protein